MLGYVGMGLARLQGFDAAPTTHSTTHPHRQTDPALHLGMACKRTPTASVNCLKQIDQLQLQCALTGTSRHPEGPLLLLADLHDAASW